MTTNQNRRASRYKVEGKAGGGAKGGALARASETIAALVATLAGTRAGAGAEDDIASEAPSMPAFWLVWLRAQLKTERIAVVAVLVLGALLFLPFLGSLGLWDPWETHYGEVAREMIARDDYLYPHWESAYFFSKPALTLWLIAFGLTISGAEGAPPNEPLGALTEWGVRLPFAMIAIFTLWAVYRIGRQIKDRATGLLAVVVLGSSAQFIFIGKQAMTDMPLVGFLTAGFAFLIAGAFDDDAEKPASRGMKLAASAGIGLSLFPQLFLIGRELQGGAVVGLVAVGLVGAGIIAALWKWGLRGDTYLSGFYVCGALAVLAKGPAALFVLGVVLVFYLFFSGDFGLVLRARVLLGSLLFWIVAAPWYVALALFQGRDDEGKTFVDRFFLHDTLARVSSGVHGDRADLGYFLEQIVYGMFPWAATIPMALGLAARWPDEERSVTKRRIVLLVLVWAVGSYVAFSMSQTKFHHYIFPAVPPLAILTALWFSWVAEAPAQRLRRFQTVLIIAVFAVGARDLINDPQLLVNLFTYKYDRDYPRELHPRAFIVSLVTVGSLAVAWFYLWRQRDRMLLAFMSIGVIFGVWVSHNHFNFLAQHWSQAHLFKTFYEERRGDEPIYAYQLNWRGETFYSRNTILQVKEKGANQRMRELVDRPGREFIITEQSRFQTLRNALSPDKRDKIRILDRSSNKFYLCVVEE
ncbi:MAG: glycosyltransferase family 39 protein [Deltaproteobacteria bacterium]|nr:glycosyltransferase family 39 protein [Deltaproteobacteria bacterium]